MQTRSSSRSPCQILVTRPPPPSFPASTNGSVHTVSESELSDRKFYYWDPSKCHIAASMIRFLCYGMASWLTGEGEENDRRMTRAGHFYSEETKAYEGSKTTQDHHSSLFASKGFRLPKGWTVDEFHRKNSYHIDKYYVEGKTGKRFRSLVSVERYLKESKNLKDQQLTPLHYHHVHSKEFSLPDGWIVEEKPRKHSSQIDRTYIEPETGDKFRSLAAVERYLKAAENGSTVKSIVHSERVSLLTKQNNSGYKTEVIDSNPPKRVKWVLTGPSGDMFSAHVSGSEVSSSVKQTWSEAFISVIQDTP
ncbi:unnamed protein product [Cochlearia groenlandica]